MKTLEELTKEYQLLGFDKNVDYNKFYLYSMIAHSTQIKGSTLTKEIRNCSHEINSPSIEKECENRSLFL